MRVMPETNPDKPTPVLKNPEPKKPKAHAIKHSVTTADAKPRSTMSVTLPSINVKGADIKAVLAGEDKP